MELMRFRLPVRVKPDDEKILKDELNKSYSFIIELSRDFFKNLLDLIKHPNRREYAGEVYCANGGSFLYFFIPPGKDFVETGWLSLNDEDKSLFTDFQDKIRSTILPDLKKEAPQWHPYIPANENFLLLKGEARHLRPTEKEMGISQVLKDENVRIILRGIEKVAQFTLDESMSEGHKMAMMSYIEMLISNNLISREFIVFCKSNNVQISRVADIVAIQEASSRGLKCPFCERIFSDERISQILSLTDFGREMIKPNLWLALHVLKLLSDLDISFDNILVKEEKNSRVYDIFINLEHYLILAEVIDTPPKLDEIFLFFSRINFCKPDVAIFITTAPLSNETRMYLSRYSGQPMVLIEGLGNMEMRLRNILRKMKGEYIKDVFSQFEPITHFNIGQAFSEYFIDKELMNLGEIITKTAEPEEAHVELVGEAGAEAVTTPPQEEETGEEDTYMPEEAIPASFVPIEKETDTEKTDESEEELFEETVETKTQEGAAVDTPESPITQPEMAAEVTGAETVVDQEEVAGHFQGPVPEMIEAVEAVEGLQDVAAPEVMEAKESAGEAMITEAEIAEAELFETDSTESYLLEEQIASSFQTEIMTMEISPAERSIDGAREQFAKRFIDEILLNGIAGNLQSLEDVIKDIKNINSYSVAMVNREGLVIINDPNEEFDSELFGAITNEIYRNIENSIKDVPFPELKSVYIARSNEVIYIYPGPEAILVLHETIETEQEEEFSQLPGETELRNIIMTKVLEDLSKIEGVTGNIVSSTDGLSIEFTFNDETDIDLLSSICSQMICDNEKYLAMLGDGSIGQIVLFTDSAIYSLVPLNSEGILISVMEPHISKEIWKIKLINSAKMIASSFQ